MSTIQVHRCPVLLISSLALLSLLGLLSSRPGSISVSPQQPQRGVIRPHTASTAALSTGPSSPASVRRKSNVSAVVRNPMPSEEEAEAAQWAVISEEVMEETEPGSQVWRASAWPDSRFTPRDLSGLRNILHWVTTTTVPCRQLEMMGAPRRSGNGRAAEQPVCLDPPLRGSKPAAAVRPTQALRGDGNTSSCLVYSFGIGEDWTFAEQMAERGCEVHVMDHRASREDEPEGEHSRGVTFHRLGVGRNRHRSAEGGLVLPLDGVLRQLGHLGRRIHYLRADLGGLEGDMLLDQLVDAKSRRDRQFVLLQADQLWLRLHLRPHVEQQLPWYWQMARALRQLQAAGYRVVHSQPLASAGLWLFPGWAEPVQMEHELLLVRARQPLQTFSPNMLP